MVKKIVLGIGIIGFLTACDCKQADCPDQAAAETTPVMSLDSTSAIVQKLIGSDNGFFMGKTLNEDIKSVNIEGFTVLEKNEEIGFSKYYNQMDLTEIDFAGVTYTFKKDKLEEVKLNVVYSYEDELDALWYEMVNYLNSKYGTYVQGLEYEKYWNQNTDDQDIVMCIKYIFPAEEFTVIEGENGGVDTLKNGPELEITAKRL